jgi:predicted nucleic acid-binding protein
MIDDKTFRLTTLSPDVRKIYTGLIGQLGKGEASCIAIAKTRSGIAVTDDRAARMVCQRPEVPVTGTVGILKASVLDGQIGLEAAAPTVNSYVSPCLG